MAPQLWIFGAALRRLMPEFELHNAERHVANFRVQNSISLKTAGKVTCSKPMLSEDPAGIIGALSDFAVHPYFPIARQFSRFAHSLRAQNKSIRRAKEQLHVDGMRSRVVGDVLIGVQIDTLAVLDSGASQRLLRCTCKCHGQTKKAANSSRLDAIEVRVAPTDHIRGHASLAICRPGQRNQFPLPGEEIFDFDGVSYGPDARIAAAHLLIDADASTLANLQTRIARELCFRAHPDGENNEVGVKCRSPLCAYNQGSVAALLKPCHSIAQPEVYAVRLHPLPCRWLALSWRHKTESGIDAQNGGV